MRKKVLIVAAAPVVLVIALGTALLARNIDYVIMDLNSVSRYNEDRIAFQHIEIEPRPYVVDTTDNSIASLMIIKDKKMYLFRDGYDNPEELMITKHQIERENRLLPDIWTNKIDDNPDYLRITERRIEVLKNVTHDFVSKNYKDKYVKWRDEFIKRHVSIFRALMVNRKESGMVVNRYALPRKLYDEGVKYAINVTGKTIDEKVYYAEDADGDGITETFAVSIPDGFNWGYESGPNIIFIYKCNYKDDNGAEKNTSIKNLIGKLAHDAYYGTAMEEKLIQSKFVKDSDIIEMIDDLYQVDPEYREFMEDHSTESK
ncbi:MAG: hypothetical protein JXA20_04520 [Spirochaetes bacterium]|nr:hypothetical protein [Spirochaetota bacterium]